MKDVQKTTNKQEEIIQNLTKLSELKILHVYVLIYYFDYTSLMFNLFINILMYIYIIINLLYINVLHCENL